MPVAPDGTRVVAADEHGMPMIYRFDGAPVEPIKGIAAGDVPA